jgi:hypothetical protein
MASVGIFWFDKDTLLPVVTPLAAAEQRGTKRDSPCMHVAEWPRVVRRYQAEHPLLTVCEYEEIPRGRIILDTVTGVFTVYMDAILFRDGRSRRGPRPAVRAALVAAFGLEGERVVFHTDPHYDTTAWRETEPEDEEPG